MFLVAVVVMAALAVPLAAYPVVAVFLAANWRLPGMPVVALGAALNLSAISVNGGVRPASPSALAEAGLPVHEPGFQNSTVLVQPRLAFLGDVFFIPASWPLSNVFSVGDILIALGIVWALHRTCRSRLAHPANTRSRRSPRPGAMPQECLNLERSPSGGA